MFDSNRANILSAEYHSQDQHVKVPKQKGKKRQGVNSDSKKRVKRKEPSQDKDVYTSLAGLPSTNKAYASSGTDSSRQVPSVKKKTKKPVVQKTLSSDGTNEMAQTYLKSGHESHGSNNKFFSIKNDSGSKAN